MKTSLLIFGLILGLTTSFVAMADQAQDHEATYSVPIPSDKPELLPHATFPLENVSHSVSNGIIRINYPLPFELTGIEQSINLKGPAPAGGQTVHLKGLNAKADCTDTQCAVTFLHLAHDFPALQDEMVKAGLTPQEIGLKMQVSRIFVEDPHGVVSFGRHY